MGKISISFLFALFCFCTTYAKEYPVRFQPDTTVKKQASFNKVIFLDLRKQKDNVGSLKAGVKKSPLVPEIPLDSMMNHFGMTLIRPAVTKEDKTLVIALNQIVVEEKYNGEFQIGNIYLDADFYIGSAERYSKVYGLDSLFEFRINEQPVLCLTKVYNRIFSRLLVAIAGVRVPEGEQAYSLAEIQDMDTRIKNDYPVYSEAPKAGIYYTVQQMLQNTPGDTEFIHKHNVGGELVSDKFYKKEEGKKKGRDLADTVCFAVYNGSKWYTAVGKEFQEMTFKNDDFYYTGKSQGLVLLSAASMGYFGGGIIGYLVADAVAEGINNDHPDRQGKAVFRYKLDPVKGRGIRIERLE